MCCRVLSLPPLSILWLPRRLLLDHTTKANKGLRKSPLCLIDHLTKPTRLFSLVGFWLLYNFAYRRGKNTLGFVLISIRLILKLIYPIFEDFFYYYNCAILAYIFPLILYLMKEEIPLVQTMLCFWSETKNYAMPCVAVWWDFYVFGFYLDLVDPSGYFSDWVYSCVGTLQCGLISAFQSVVCCFISHNETLVHVDSYVAPR